MKMKRFLMIAVMVGMAMSVSAQDSKYGHGEDSVACVTNLSMYREYFKQWEAAKYAPESISMEMVNAWREVFLKCPRASQFVYTNGEKIMEYFIRTKEPSISRLIRRRVPRRWPTLWAVRVSSSTRITKTVTKRPTMC